MPSIKVQILGFIASVATIVVLCLIVMAGEGCTPVADDADALARITLPQSVPDSLVYLSLLVSGPQMDDIERRVELGSQSEPLTIELKVPAGQDRLFLCQAFGSDDVLFYQGQIASDVIAGEQLDLTIEMAARATVRGTIYQAGFDDYPGNPLSSFHFEGDDDHPQIQTDGSGAYSLSLELGERELLVEHEQSTALVLLSLEQAGQVLDLDVYLVDRSREGPALYALMPDGAAEGDYVVLHGAGFMPLGAPAPQAVFGDAAEIFVSAQSYDDTTITVQIPIGLGAGPGWIQVYQSMYAAQSSRSNYINLTIE
ncbi:MAG: hypothetical protein P9M14_13610 [Candidatus Alcyoniella australis]|nr:hypothetical protein [Candidatus Alcyoniella australis]